MEAFILSLLLIMLQLASAAPLSCGDGVIGGGICAVDGQCCSKQGQCGNTTAHCKEYCGKGQVNNGQCRWSHQCCSVDGHCRDNEKNCSGRAVTTPTNASIPASSTLPTRLPASRLGDSRLIAYVGNWQTCPTATQVAKYTHIVIAFAVSYQWSPWKNICSKTCDIAVPPICGSAPNPELVRTWQNAGKKVILSFGGAGMGGSWDGLNDCWEYCFGRETKVVNQLVSIVKTLNLNGVDLDYEYYHENRDGFQKGPQAQRFLTKVTTDLRAKLPVGSIVTHAPMDVDLVPGTGYYRVLKKVADSLDFIMPQYYNGITKPITNFKSALSHYTTLANNLFNGDATRIVFGFCISDCSAMGSNVRGTQAKQVMKKLARTYPCNGGAFFWVALHDTNGMWSRQVSSAVAPSSGCSRNAPATAAQAPTRSPTPLSSTTNSSLLVQPADTVTTAKPSSPTTSAPATLQPPTLVTQEPPSPTAKSSSPTTSVPVSPQPPTSTTKEPPSPTAKPSSPTTSAPATAQPPTSPATPEPPPSPTAMPQPLSPCGGGAVGNGICAIDGQCCSEWGWCASIAAHCTHYCGQGHVNNGRCRWSHECCSHDGYCGAEHC